MNTSGITAKLLIIATLIMCLLLICGVSGCDDPKGIDAIFNPSSLEQVKNLQPPAYGEAPFGLSPPGTEGRTSYQI